MKDFPTFLQWLNTSSSNSRLWNDFSNEFGEDIVYSITKDTYIEFTPSVFKKIFIIANKHMFNNKLKMLDVEYIQLSDEHYISAFASYFNFWKKMISRSTGKIWYISLRDPANNIPVFRVYEHSFKYPFSFCVSIVVHEMIHYYVNMYDQTQTKIINRLFRGLDIAQQHDRDIALRRQYEEYDVHGGVFYEKMQELNNRFGLDIRVKYYKGEIDSDFESAIQKMRSISMKSHKTKRIAEDIDEEPLENRNTINDEYAKCIYDLIKTPDYKHIEVSDYGVGMTIA